MTRTIVNGHPFDDPKAAERYIEHLRQQGTVPDIRLEVAEKTNHEDAAARGTATDRHEAG